jgi:hypothetical protein
VTGRTRVSRIHFTGKEEVYTTCSCTEGLYSEDQKLEKEEEGKGGKR